MSKSIERYVEELICNLLDGEYELIDIEYIKEQGEYYLRIYFDKKEGLTLDDCEYLSKLIGERLDSDDFIKNPYYLEISSPGVERVLKNKKDFIREKGKKIRIKFYHSLDGQKEIIAILNGLDDNGNILVNYNDENISLNIKEIAKVNLYFEI